MQEGFRYATNLKIVSNINKLINNFNGEIVFLQFINKKGSRFEKQLKWKKFQNKKDQEILKEIKINIPKNYKKFKHYNYSILTREVLNEIKNKEIYICGFYTNLAIIKTAIDLFDLNKKCFIIEDACAAQFKQSFKNSAIESLTHIIGKKQILKTKDNI